MCFGAGWCCWSLVAGASVGCRWRVLLQGAAVRVLLCCLCFGAWLLRAAAGSRCRMLLLGSAANNFFWVAIWVSAGVINILRERERERERETPRACLPQMVCLSLAFSSLVQGDRFWSCVDAPVTPTFRDDAADAHHDSVTCYVE